MACSSYCQGSHIGADCCVLISQPVQLQVEKEDIELTKVYLKTPIKMVVVSGGEGNNNNNNDRLTAFDPGQPG